MGKVDAGKEPGKGEGAGISVREDAHNGGTPSASARKGQSPSGAPVDTAATITRRHPGSNGRKTPQGKHVEPTHPDASGHGVAPIEANAGIESANERKGSRARGKLRSRSVVTTVPPAASEQFAQPSEHLNPSDMETLSADEASALAAPSVAAAPAADQTASVIESVAVEGHAEQSGPAIPSASASAPSQCSPRSELRARAANALIVGRDLLIQAAGSPAVSRLLHTATGIARVVRAGLGVSIAPSLDEYGKDPELERELQPVYSFLLDRYWRLQVEHAERVPAGPAILVANHSGALPVDGPVLHHALARQRPDLREPRWLVEDQIYRAPFIGTLLNRLGAVQAAPENALRLLGEERPVIVFPEGIEGIGKRFAERYRLMRFGRGGFAKIALRMRAPIVPVAIVGAEEASPLLWKLPGAMFGIPYVPITSPLPLPSRWMIRFGNPIYLEDLPSEAAQDQEVVQDLTDRTRGSIQAMITELLEVRGSAFAR